MTDTYSVRGRPGNWRVLREDTEIAAYRTQGEALNVAGRLEAAFLDSADERILISGAGAERRSFGRRT